MAFIKIQPRIGKSLNTIKVSFTGKEGIYANLHIGKDLLRKIEWMEDERVCVSYDEENPRIWLLEKASKDNVEESFKLVLSNRNGNICRLQFRFYFCYLKQTEKNLRKVNYEIQDGNKILIKI